ncbi:hypothetical protein ACH5RR_004216 [Cinchona calisaya]|uniref:Uncharacterized protein n=1 Tax=Cinchona calisaya TaxID=153742 RepID=A0ABD3AX07_9GENT
MLLRTISNTKKFFQKTVENFKSFLSGGYERLPKNSPCSSFPCGGSNIHHQLNYTRSYRELDSTHHDQQTIKGREKKKESSRNESRIRNNLTINYTNNVGSGPEKRNYQQVDRKVENDEKKKRIIYEGKKRQVLKVERSFLVMKKLKELEMIDKSNMEHVLDIEEVLHYYSRLTCPAYVDLVDRFFMDMYAELLNNGQAAASSHINNSSRSMLKRVGLFS